MLEQHNIELPISCELLVSECVYWVSPKVYPAQYPASDRDQ